MMALEFFRPDHGHEQISEEDEGDRSHNKVSHNAIPKVFHTSWYKAHPAGKR